MGPDRALRFPGRARGVKNGGIVIRIDRHVRQRPVGQKMPGVDLADHGFKLDDLRVRHLFALAADEDALQFGAIVQMFRQPPEPLAIDDRDLRA